MSIIAKALDMAMKAGCSAARVGYGEGVQSNYTVHNDCLEKIEQAAGRSLELQLFMEGRYGSFSTNRLDEKDLQTFISQAVAQTRLLAPEPERTLPLPERCYHGQTDLRQFDVQVAEMSPEAQKALTFQCAREVVGQDPRIIAVETAFSASTSTYYIMDSQGFCAENRQSQCSLSAEVSLKDKDEARPSAWWYEASLFLKDLSTKHCGHTALARALAKLGPKKLPSGRYPIVVESSVTAQLLSPLLAAMSGSAIQQNNSFLLHKLGQSVGSSLLQVVDRPHLCGAIGARMFDSEGVATQEQKIFADGRLSTYFIDTYNSNKLGMPPTIGGPSLLEWEGGKGLLPTLLQSLGKGILITGFNGGNCNGATGDFSYGIEGFEIENGKQGAPISEMLISGNMLELWQRLCLVGNDARQCSSWRIPSLGFELVDCSGF